MNKLTITKKKMRYISLFILCIVLSMVYADDGIERIIFDERRIEGKIRRPQLVLIKAEQRPKFSPMVMQSLDSDLNAIKFASESAIEKSPYSGVFNFDGTKISNYEP